MISPPSPHHSGNSRRWLWTSLWRRCRRWRMLPFVKEWEEWSPGRRCSRVRRSAVARWVWALFFSRYQLFLSSLTLYVKIARGCVEEPGGSNAAAPGSQDQLQAGKGGLKKKNLSRRNLRQKLKSNLKSPARGIPQEEPSSQSSNGMQFLCPICNKTFPSLTQLNKHQKFHMQK